MSQALFWVFNSHSDPMPDKDVEAPEVWVMSGFCVAELGMPRAPLLVGSTITSSESPLGLENLRTEHRVWHPLTSCCSPQEDTTALYWKHSQGWRDGSAVSGAGCFGRGLKFGSQCPQQRGSQYPVIPASGEPTSLLASWGTCTYMNKPTPPPKKINTLLAWLLVVFPSKH